MIPSTLRLSLLAALLGSALAVHAATLMYRLLPNQAATIPPSTRPLGR